MHVVEAFSDNISYPLPLAVEQTLKGYCLRIIWVVRLVFNPHRNTATFHDVILCTVSPEIVHHALLQCT